MRDVDKSKLFWQITNNLNKNFCDNKIKINEIILFDKTTKHPSKPKRKIGLYDMDNKIIFIKKGQAFLYQIFILVHEYVHAYQFQILGYGEKEVMPDTHSPKDSKYFYKFLRYAEIFLEKRGLINLEAQKIGEKCKRCGADIIFSKMILGGYSVECSDNCFAKGRPEEFIIQSEELGLCARAQYFKNFKVKLGEVTRKIKGYKVTTLVYD